MKREIEIVIDFRPAFVAPLLALFLVAVPPFAATGDNIDARMYATSASGIYQTLTTTGPTDLAFDASGAASNAVVAVGAGTTWTGRLLVGASNGGSADDTPGCTAAGGCTPGSRGSMMIINGHTEVTGCIILTGGGAISKKCNWCRPGYPCSPSIY